MLSSIGLSRFSGRGSEDIGNPTSELDSTRPDGGAAAKKKAAAKSQKNKAWNQMNRNVEKVVDTIGETISEEFYEFLETLVPP